MGIEITGFAYDSAGAALASKSVNLYDRNTTTNSRASTTTNSDGKFTFSNSDVTVSSVYQMDVEITDGSNKTRYKYDDEIMLQRVDVKDFVLRSGSANQYVGTVVPTTLTADRTYTLPNHTGNILAAPSVTLDSANRLFLNDTASSSLNINAGLCINGGASTTQMIELKTGNSFAHGLTGTAETDTFGTFGPADSNGGLRIVGINDAQQSDSFDGAVQIRGVQKATANSGSTNSASAPVIIEGIEHDGSNGMSELGADENVVVFKKASTDSSTTHIFKGDGDIFVDGSTTITAFDDYDDVALLTAWNGAVTQDNRYKVEFKSWVDEHKDTLESLGIIAPNSDGTFHYSIKNLNTLMVGAIRQLGAKVNKLEEQLALKGA
tara:strand:- start:241 stop:1377 length:1137 start_codon:yes stop_codon:yes gene_type:complete